MKKCPSCGRSLLGRRNYCREHGPTSRPRKGTSEAGYGAAHQAARRAWAPLVARGDVECHECHRFIGLGDLWDLDHTDDRRGYLGPAHRSCNRRKAARKKNRMYPRGSK